MSADEELGYVYLPVSTPTNDYYGGHRPGDGLYGDSLVCLEAATGKKVWHYQFVHHGLWDYDTPAAPNLIDITVEGKPIKAVAQVTKQAFVYVFDRVTGQPVWPIEERPVPASSVPGESASKTQPFPTKPAPIDIQGLRDEDLIDLTPQIHKEAIDIVLNTTMARCLRPRRSAAPSRYRGSAAVRNWSGAAIDPETGMFYAGTYRVPFVATVGKPIIGEFLRFHRSVPLSGGPQGLPLLKPPFGSIVAIDMNTGEHRWRIPVGRGELIPAIQRLGIHERLGFLARSWALVTRTVMIVVQMGYYSAPRLQPGGNRQSTISTISIRICGSTTRPQARCWRRLRCRLTRPARRSPIWPAASNIIAFPVGGGPLVEELIAVSF